MKSMTGYGAAETTAGHKKLYVEVRTVNHRFCEVNFRLPSHLFSLETELLDFTKKCFQRGRIDIQVREKSEGVKAKVRIDEAQLETYIKLHQKIAKKLKVKNAPQVEDLLTLPKVLVLEEEEAQLKDFVSPLKKALTQAFKNVDQMRLKEGREIQKTFQKHLSLLEAYVEKVQSQIPKMLEDYKLRLKERIEKLSSQNLDEWRLSQEIAYYVDRTDVAEELQRLSSHLQHFSDVLKEEEPVGRKLDFLLQEMNREINTLGSKAQNSLVSQWVVCCKHELEKMREQVQNVE